MSWLVRIVLLVLGVLAVVVGVVYVIEPIHSLPSFFPGHGPHGQGHRDTRGYFAIAVGVVLLILAGVIRRFRRQSGRHDRSRDPA